MVSKVRGKNETIRVAVLPYVVRQSYLTWFVSRTLCDLSVLPCVVRQSNPFQSFPEIKKEAEMISASKTVLLLFKFSVYI